MKGGCVIVLHKITAFEVGLFDNFASQAVSSLTDPASLHFMASGASVQKDRGSLFQTVAPSAAAERLDIVA
jgi:hypothetical protein